MRECSFKSRSHFGKTFHVNRSQQEVSEVYLEVQQKTFAGTCSLGTWQAKTGPSCSKHH